MSIGRKIAKMRKEMGWTREQLAQECKVSKKRIIEWEFEEDEPSIKSLVKLSEIFNLPIDEIVKYEEEEDEEEELIVQENRRIIKVLDTYVEVLFSCAADNVFSTIYTPYNLYTKDHNLSQLKLVCELMLAKYTNEIGQIYSKYLLKNTTVEERKQYVNCMRKLENNEEIEKYIEGECEIDEVFQMLRNKIQEMEENAEEEHRKKRRSAIAQNFAALKFNCRIMSNMKDLSKEKQNGVREDVCTIISKVKNEGILGELVGFFGERVIDAFDRKDMDRLKKLSGELREIQAYVLYRCPMEEDLNSSDN